MILFMGAIAVERIVIKRQISNLLSKYEHLTNPMKELKKILEDPIVDQSIMKDIQKLRLQAHDTLQELINHQKNYLMIINEIRNLPSSSS